MGILNQYTKLLASRESREVLGKKWANAWLLTIVLAVTFVSIAFSNGSMLYLSEKMNDPFTNWVNIDQEYRSERARDFFHYLENNEVKSHYKYDYVQYDHYMPLTFVGRNGEQPFLQVRFFEDFGGKIIEAVLSEDNIVDGICAPANVISANQSGLIITEEALGKLGYDLETPPAYVNWLSPSQDAEVLGVKVDTQGFANAPLPLLGVVKKLPGNMDVIGPGVLADKIDDFTNYPLNLNNESYQHSAHYFVPESISDNSFEKVVKSVLPDTLLTNVYILNNTNLASALGSWQEGRYLSIYFNGYHENSIPTEVYHSIANAVEQTFGPQKAWRLFDYVDAYKEKDQGNYISISFNSLDSIRSFERMANDKYNIKLEMSQVSAKENFNAVSVMANILSLVMILFSMACIILFIVNMLQSYFQKVKRNLGTFKAFGIKTGELIGVYILIIGAIVVGSIIVALIFAMLVQEILPIFNVLKDNTYNYLSLWSYKTIGSIIIMLVATILTVRIQMARLLRKTPGDLIYDRD